MAGFDYRYELRGSTGSATGWQGYLVDLDDDGQDEVVFFCPGCAAREFGNAGAPGEERFERGA